MQFKLNSLKMSKNFGGKSTHYKKSWNEIRIQVECNSYKKWYRWASLDKTGMSNWMGHQDLLGQMSRIREKATESEAVVRNITKDIQVLDLAKKNLILSMTTLKRLQMLGASLVFFTVIFSETHRAVNALTQLEDLIQDKKYDEIAQTLSVNNTAHLFLPIT